MKFNCPNCGELLTKVSDGPGRTTKCPYCGEQLMVAVSKRKRAGRVFSDAVRAVFAYLAPRENSKWVILGAAFIIGMALHALLPRYHVYGAYGYIYVTDRWTGKEVNRFGYGQPIRLERIR